MNQRRILNKLLILILLFSIGCSTSKSSLKGNKGGEFEFNPIYQFAHLTSDTTGLYLRFKSDELLYMRSNEAADFVANVRVKLIQNTGIYSSFNDNLQNTLGLSQDQLLTDSAPYVYSQWRIALRY